MIVKNIVLADAHNPTLPGGFDGAVSPGGKVLPRRIKDSLTLLGLASGLQEQGKSPQRNCRHPLKAAELPIFAPAQEEAILREAGFSDVSLFYVGFAFRGWVAYAKHP